MVESFEWLETYTDLTSEQIHELQNMERPFTILTQAPYIDMFLQLEDENGEIFENAKEYKEIAFRVAHNDLQRELIHDI